MGFGPVTAQSRIPHSHSFPLRGRRDPQHTRSARGEGWVRDQVRGLEPVWHASPLGFVRMRTETRTWMWSRFLLTISMVLLVAMCLALVAVRAQATGQVRDSFLVFNLFLGVLPFPFALGSDYLLRKRHWYLALPFASLWLLLLPNSPYLMTDLVHFTTSNVPGWYDTLLYGSFAVTGVLLGFGSVALIHSAIRERFGRRRGWSAAIAALMLSAFGIYLGRIERWNSWNILENPKQLAKSVLAPIRNPLANVRTVGFVFLYSVFLVLGYLAVAMIGRISAALHVAEGSAARPSAVRPSAGPPSAVPPSDRRTENWAKRQRDE